MRKLLFLFIFLSSTAQANDLCEVLNLENCNGVQRQRRRASAQSLPSPASSAQFNPANVSHDRGFGLEVMYQPSLAPSVSVAAGTGKSGAALISSGLENSFFSPPVVELAPDLLERKVEQDQYESKKQTLATSFGLFKNRRFSLDVAAMAKYNSDIKRVNPGGGVALRFGALTLGSSLFQDDVFLDFKNLENPATTLPYSVQYGSDTYSERYIVKTYFGGFHFKNLFFDAGVIQTYSKFYEDDIRVNLYSMSYIWRRWLFNLAVRHENSQTWKVKNEELLAERKKNETYGALQYSFGNRIVLGVHHNYYLLREWAMSATVFF